MFTDDDELAEVLRSLRVHGQGTDKYDNVRIGMNGRLDTLQAAILLEKLAIFDDEIAARDARRRPLRRGCSTDVASCPVVRAGATSVWAQYTIRLPGRDRDAVAARAARRRACPTASTTRSRCTGRPPTATIPVGGQRAAGVRAAGAGRC